MDQPVQNPTWKDILSPTAYRLYRELLRLPISEATIEELQELAGTSKAGVGRAIQELEEHGLVSLVED